MSRFVRSPVAGYTSLGIKERKRKEKREKRREKRGNNAK
jgi:hypothetical protein